MNDHELRQGLEKIAPIIGEGQARALWMRYLTAKDRERKERARRTISLLTESLVGGFEEKVLLPPPAKEDCAGDINIGKTHYNNKDLYPCGIKRQDLMKHVGIFGQTGSGKTNIAFQLIQTLTEEGIPFIVFDWKRNFRDLLLNPELNNKLKIYTVGRNVAPFHFNPKTPPQNSDAESYQKKLCQIIEWAYFLGQGAHDIIMETYDKGNFAQMRDYLLKQRKQGREMLWWASGKRTLNALNYGQLGQMFNHLRPHNMAKLLKQSVILELDGLTEADKCFVAGSILNWIMEYRRSQPERETLKHVLIIEEAHHLFRKKAETKPEDITDTIFREVREYGQSLIILDQHPHRTSTQALGNSGTIIALKTTLAQDRKALSQSMLLQRFEEHYPGLLNPGQAIIKNTHSPRPFLLSVPKFQIQKGTVTDQQLKATMNRTSPEGKRKTNEQPYDDHHPGLKFFSPPTPSGMYKLKYKGS